uniref:HTH psq-type domain-containing protein n=1 Tax=Caenorhabditis tropicalis TaxID=1561998 RepID=A0A1I7TWQ1_9PELO
MPTWMPPTNHTNVPIHRSTNGHQPAKAQQSAPGGLAYRTNVVAQYGTKYKQQPRKTSLARLIQAAVLL